ncbi:MAG: response regulator [Candidatus Riflebacteria bacterium]|nr:response regulator [Candidatus Riflebacteria bacterium]
MAEAGKTKGVVLIVDDDEDLRRLLQRHLQKLEYAVKLCGTGEAALKLATSQRIDLILVDHSMPGMGGFEVIQKLRKANVASKIVVITAALEEEVFDRYLDSNLAVDGFVNKPFDAGQVERCMETILVRNGKFVSPF